jgi:hypothetical protein
METQHELGIFWKGKDGHDEVEGLFCYALSKKMKSTHIEDFVKAIWPTHTVALQVDMFQYHNTTISIVALKMLQWPTDSLWMQYLQETMQALVRCGASVVWAGGEDCTWNPDVLNPASMMGNVYAGYSKETGFLCNTSLSEEIVYLSDAQLEALYASFSCEVGRGVV